MTEGAKLKSSGNIQGGDGLSLSSGSISGGNASVALADSATFPNFSIASGSDDTSGPNVGAGGSAYLGLTSSKTSLALTIGFGGSSGTAQINVTIAGSSLATITPSFSGSYSPSSGGSLNLDFSGCVLVDAAIDAIVNGLMSIGIQTGAANLNVGGSCHPASTGTQTDIATLQGRGWNVIYNT